MAEPDEKAAVLQQVPPQPASDTSNKKLPDRVEAMYDCDGDEDDELSFVSGEIIAVDGKLLFIENNFTVRARIEKIDSWVLIWFSYPGYKKKQSRHKSLRFLGDFCHDFPKNHLKNFKSVRFSETFL